MSKATATTPSSEQRDDSATADRIERHVDRIITALTGPTAAEAFEALVAEHNLTVEEWDTTTLDEDLRDKFYAICIESRGNKIIAVPIGQDPEHRLAAVRALLAHLAVTA